MFGPPILQELALLFVLRGPIMMHSLSVAMAQSPNAAALKPDAMEFAPIAIETKLLASAELPMAIFAIRLAFALQPTATAKALAVEVFPIATEPVFVEARYTTAVLPVTAAASTDDSAPMRM